MDTLDTKTLLLYGLAALVCVWWLRPEEKSTVPAVVGSKGVISSYVAALYFLRHGGDVIDEGYHRYPDGVFRVPTLFRWDYIANGRQRVAEIAAAPEDVLSFNQAALQSDYTIGPQIARNPYVVEVVRGTLTRNIARSFPMVRDEITHAFDDVLSLENDDWKELRVYPNTMQIVARVSNRIFVGLPLCREQEYLDLNINYTVAIVMRGLLIALLPRFLQPILGPLISTRKSSLRHGLKFLGPVIDERLENEREHGRHWPDRPNDLISWLLDVAEGEERTTPALALRVLGLNMAAIHTTSMALTAALFDLTTYPEHILPMREEAERVIAEEGWSKASLAHMYNMDSFLRESQRLRGSGAAVGMLRKVVAKDGFMFSDGIKIPYGSFLSVSAIPMSHDPSNYENATTFDGFRFSRLREQQAAHNDVSEGPSFFNRHMVSTAQDHVVFGHGQHACPGRFFAATELKAMLAHLLINYDIKAKTEGVRPPDDCFGIVKVPSLRGTIMIRKRA
ncbi:cytochrome P450 [Mycena latifolia]|nr:cytochrome P450 [Mycena latifolia]